MYSPEEHAKFESLARNRIANIAFAVCSSGEVIILVIMVGILKAVKSDQSTENNTRAFSILLAFAGGMWRKSNIFRCRLSTYQVYSPLLHTMVYLRETATWTQNTSEHQFNDDWSQASLRRVSRMYEIKANLPLLGFLLPYVGSPFLSRCILPYATSQG